MEVYSDESDSITDEKEVLLDVDLNWIVSEVCQQMCCVVQDISFSEYQQPLHIRTELFVTKLIIYNLISYAGKCTSVKESIELRTSKRTNWAVFSVEFETSQNKETELKNIMAIKQDQALQSDSVSNSFDEGILTSRTLAEQIDGILDFSCTEEGLSTLSLKIPLSYSDN
jgi:light-regulated signal transduction histidine kinase (bacteriophytochrome)